MVGGCWAQAKSEMLAGSYEGSLKTTGSLRHHEQVPAETSFAKYRTADDQEPCMTQHMLHIYIYIYVHTTALLLSLRFGYMRSRKISSTICMIVHAWATGRCKKGWAKAWRGWPNWNPI